MPAFEGQVCIVLYASGLLYQLSPTQAAAFPKTPLTLDTYVYWMLPCKFRYLPTGVPLGVKSGSFQLHDRVGPVIPLPLTRPGK